MVGRSSVERVTYFDESVQGLEPGSPVKFRGVPIGVVSGIAIAPDRRHVEVRARIYTDELRRMGLGAGETSAGDAWLDPARRPPEVRVQLASAGITGVKFLQVDFFKPGSAPPPVLPFEVPPNYFPSQPSTLKTLEAALADLTEELPDMLMRAGNTLEVTGHTLDSVRMTLEPLVAPDGPIVGALQEFRVTAAALRKGVEAADLGSTAAAARRASDAVTRAADSIGAAAGSLGTTAQSVNGLTVDASALAEDLHASLEQLGQSLDAFRALVDYLERNPAALLRGREELARWTQPPAAWVEQRLARELFERRGLRRALAGAYPLLQVNLLAFDEVLEPEHAARVEATARLTDASGAALLERTYAAQQPLEGRAPEDVARAMGTALAEVIGRLAADAAGSLAPS